MRRIINFINILKPIFSEFYFSFTSSHANYLKSNNFRLIEKLSIVNFNDGLDIIRKFEKLFSSKIGKGKFISFSSGRASLSVLLECFEISEQDEVIIQSSNCSAVAFSIIMSKAKPIYVDINPNDFGPLYSDIENKINSKTKAIVVQHSFGIPSSSIFKIKELCNKNNIYLIEDCALTFDSSINGINIGTIGDASFFSTDNSKPLNTIVGGGVYSESNTIINKALKIQNCSEEFSKSDLKKIHQRFLIETTYLTPKKYRYFKLNTYLRSIFNKIFGLDVLLFEYSTDLNVLKNNHIKKMPVFLAQIGIYEIENWNKKKAIILKNYSDLLNIFKNSKYALPNSYFKNGVKIIPHRFILFDNENNLKNILTKNINDDLFWFKSPLIACLDPREYGYQIGSCSNTEKFNNIIINIPLIFNDKYYKKFINNLKSLS